MSMESSLPYGYVVKRITSAKTRCEKEKQNSAEFLKSQIKVSMKKLSKIKQYIHNRDPDNNGI